MDASIREQTTGCRRALTWFSVGALAAIAWLARPFAVGILLGALMAFTLDPLYTKLVRRTRRPLLTSLAIVLSSGVLVLLVAAGFLTLFATRAVQLADVVRQGLRPDGTLAEWANTANGWLDGHGVDPATLAGRLQNGAGEIAQRSASFAGVLAAGTFGALLGLFFALLTMYAVLRYWPQMVASVVTICPLHPRHTRAVLQEFRRAGRTTLAGAVVTGFAQGILAGIGFWFTGVPQPVVFGAATVLASLIPGIGTLLVWVPAAIYLFATDHAGLAIVELVWSALTVIGLSDYVIRPRLVGDEAMPTLLVFVALFGGVEVFGLPGLIAGPILMALAVAALRLYAREARRSRPKPARAY